MYKRIPPRAAPAQVAPAIDPPAAPPAPDSGRIYIDVDGAVATIGRVTKIEQKEETRGGVTMIGNIAVPTTVTVDVEERTMDVLCTTPCWFDLPFGKSHLISITGLGSRQSDIISLSAKSDPWAYRHALSRHDKPDVGKRLPGALLFGLGLGLVVTTPLLALIVDSPVILIGYGGGGVAAGALGLLLLRNARAIQQDGAGVSYALPPRM